MNNELLAKYDNGPVRVKIYDDGTKIREWDETKYGYAPKLEFPESFDCKITNVCNMGCPFCFPDGVLVKTPYGEKTIESIKPGDQVISMNTKTNKLEVKTVTKVYKRSYEGDFVKNYFGSTNLPSTPNHRIFTQVNGYKRADLIDKLDKVIFLKT